MVLTLQILSLLGLAHAHVIPRRLWHHDLPDHIVNHPKMRRSASMDEAIPGEFIVGVRRGKTKDVLENIQMFTEGGFATVKGTYKSSSTFQINVPRSEFRSMSSGSSLALSAAMSDPDVDYVEPNQKFKAFAYGWGIGRIDKRTNRSVEVNHQLAAVGLGITGEGVDVFVVDTGVEISHQEFEGRAVDAFSAFGKEANDKQGHGTHCAGTIGGKTYGIAPKATIHAVKVLDDNGGGSTATIIAGLDAIVSMKKKDRPAVVSMSLGGGLSRAVDDAISNLLDAGFIVVSASGNEGIDGCTVSPGANRNVINVGASNENDEMSSYSNYGSCVDILAPGDDIVSAGLNNKMNDVKTGTSMAAPHVSGVVALYLSKFPNALPEEVMDALLLASSKGLLKIPTDKPRQANRLLYANPKGYIPPKEVNNIVVDPSDLSNLINTKPTATARPDSTSTNFEDFDTEPAACLNGEKCESIQGKADMETIETVTVTVPPNQKKRIVAFLNGPPGTSLVLSQSKPVVERGTSNVIVRYSLVKIQPAVDAKIVSISRCVPAGRYRFTVLVNSVESLAKDLKMWVQKVSFLDDC